MVADVSRTLLGYGYKDRGISTSVEEKAMAAGARMWESKMFTEDQMVAWENNPPSTRRG
jgi:hypothetical protein